MRAHRPADRLRRSREGNEGAHQSVHGFETASIIRARGTVSIACLYEPATGTLPEGIVAAGIKDDHIHAVFRIINGLQHQFGFDPFGRDLALVLNVVVYWDEEILPIDLDAVPGKIKQAYTAKLDALAELTDGIGHLAL